MVDHAIVTVKGSPFSEVTNGKTRRGLPAQKSIVESKMCIVRRVLPADRSTYPHSNTDGNDSGWARRNSV